MCARPYIYLRFESPAKLSSPAGLLGSSSSPSISEIQHKPSYNQNTALQLLEIVWNNYQAIFLVLKIKNTVVKIFKKNSPVYTFSLYSII